MSRASQACQQRELHTIEIGLDVGGKENNSFPCLAESSFPLVPFSLMVRNATQDPVPAGFSAAPSPSKHEKHRERGMLPNLPCGLCLLLHFWVPGEADSGKGSLWVPRARSKRMCPEDKQRYPLLGSILGEPLGFDGQLAGFFKDRLSCDPWNGFATPYAGDLHPHTRPHQLPRNNSRLLILAFPLPILRFPPIFLGDLCLGFFFHHFTFLLGHLFQENCCRCSPASFQPSCRELVSLKGQPPSFCSR